jgi:hypothetical protein
MNFGSKPFFNSRCRAVARPPELKPNPVVVIGLPAGTENYEVQVATVAKPRNGRDPFANRSVYHRPSLDTAKKLANGIVEHNPRKKVRVMRIVESLVASN